MDDPGRTFMIGYNSTHTENSSGLHTYTSNLIPSANVICFRPKLSELNNPSVYMERRPFITDSSYSRSLTRLPASYSLASQALPQPANTESSHQDQPHLHELNSGLIVSPQQVNESTELHHTAFHRSGYCTDHTSEGVLPVPQMLHAPFIPHRYNACTKVSSDDGLQKILEKSEKASVSPDLHSYSFDLENYSDFGKVVNPSDIYGSQSPSTSLGPAIGLLQLSQAAQYYSQHEQVQQILRDHDLPHSVTKTELPTRPVPLFNAEQYQMDLPPSSLDSEEIKQEDCENLSTGGLRIDVWSAVTSASAPVSDTKLRDPVLHTPNWGVELMDIQNNSHPVESVQQMGYTDNVTEYQLHQSKAVTQGPVNSPGASSRCGTLCEGDAGIEHSRRSCITPPNAAIHMHVMTATMPHREHQAALDLTESKPNLGSNHILQQKREQQYHSQPPLVSLSSSSASHPASLSTGVKTLDNIFEHNFTMPRETIHSMIIDCGMNTATGQEFVPNQRVKMTDTRSETENHLIFERNKANFSSGLAYFSPSKAFLNRYNATSQKPEDQGESVLEPHTSPHILTDSKYSAVSDETGGSSECFPDATEFNRKPGPNFTLENMRASNVTGWASEWLRAGGQDPVIAHQVGEKLTNFISV